MKAMLERLPRDERDRLRRRAQPTWIDPMLATLTDDRFSDEAWIFERKVDGERCLGFRKDGEVRLLSRNRKELNDTYPELAGALTEGQRGDFIVDGEIVAFEGAVTSFARLQQRMHVREAKPDDVDVAVYYYLFDLLYLDGFDTTELPLRWRKSMLKQTFGFRDPLRFMPHRNGDGEAYHKEACRKGWEGVIAKRAASTYQHGRSRDWLKFKCVREQELVVGGYTEPRGSRKGFGALLLGYYERGALVYAGEVGTGFDDRTLAALKERMGRMELDAAPFAKDGLPRKGIHWIRPELVAQVRFTEWTQDGKLRHPRFLGLREDKEPRDVGRERP